VSFKILSSFLPDCLSVAQHKPARFLCIAGAPRTPFNFFSSFFFRSNGFFPISHLFFSISEYCLVRAPIGPRKSPSSSQVLLLDGFFFVTVPIPCGPLRPSAFRNFCRVLNRLSIPHRSPLFELYLPRALSLNPALFHRLAMCSRFRTSFTGNLFVFHSSFFCWPCSFFPPVHPSPLTPGSSAFPKALGADVPPHVFFSPPPISLRTLCHFSFPFHPGLFFSFFIPTIEILTLFFPCPPSSSSCCLPFFLYDKWFLQSLRVCFLFFRGGPNH